MAWEWPSRINWDGVRVLGEYANPVTGTVKMAQAIYDMSHGENPYDNLTSPLSSDVQDIERNKIIPSDPAKMAMIGGGIVVGLSVIALAWNVGKDPAGFALRTKKAIDEYKTMRA